MALLKECERPGSPHAINITLLKECDYAISVFFKKRNDSFWFASSLVEFVDHAPGTEVTIDGVAKTWVRTDTGEWREESTATKRTKPWWRFWK